MTANISILIYFAFYTGIWANLEMYIDAHVCERKLSLLNGNCMCLFCRFKWSHEEEDALFPTDIAKIKFILGVDHFYIFWLIYLLSTLQNDWIISKIN